ncbi:hypothetical protein DB42_AX00020 [Neochlamydia sp. EPS4]|nr:hypothetical protein DB42_AX00020 [Neochlamydia sp. EPS4]
MRQKEPFLLNKAKNHSSFSQTKIAVSLNRQNLWLLLNAWRVSTLALDLSGKKARLDHLRVVFH